MSYTRDVYCPRCDHNFPVEKDDGDTAACPQCCCEFEVEWSADEDGENVRAVVMNNDFPQPKYATVAETVLAWQDEICSQMGVPAEFITVQPSTRFIEQSTIRRRYTTVMEEIKHQLSIRTQAEYMGMRLENNRKRMRKRVRQRLRRWTILDEHWTNNLNGDW